MVKKQIKPEPRACYIINTLRSHQRPRITLFSDLGLVFRQRLILTIFRHCNVVEVVILEHEELEVFKIHQINILILQRRSHLCNEVLIYDQWIHKC